jgi:curved DNA-binding protein CbpA
MGSQGDPEDRSAAVPQLAPDCDPASLPLSPAEGFLLSRIDGRTSWRLLRAVGGLSAPEVDRCLARWIDEGVLILSGDKPDPPPAAAAGPSAGSDAAVDALLDPTLDLPLEQQRAVLDFEVRLERPYHEILDVPADADARVVKRAYFRLSKEFHPDRYFRRSLGGFAERIERVFRKITEAYELLSDPSARAEVARSLEEEARSQAPTAPAAVRPARRRGPHAFSLLARIGRERRRKARLYFEQGVAARDRERWVEAAQHLRLALACDPRNEAYRGIFGEVAERANALRADRYKREADSHFELGDYHEAYQDYEQALHFRPFDAEMNHRAAKLAWRSENDLKAAKEYAARACETSPDVAVFRRTLGQVYAAAELHANARRELEHALRLDPTDEEAKQELRNVKRKARRGPRGGS